MSENNMEVKARKTIQHIHPYTPGKPIWELQNELGLTKVIKLASNENPLQRHLESSLPCSRFGGKRIGKRRLYSGVNRDPASYCNTLDSARFISYFLYSSTEPSINKQVTNETNGSFVKYFRGTQQSAIAQASTAYRAPLSKSTNAR